MILAKGANVNMYRLSSRQKHLCGSYFSFKGIYIWHFKAKYSTTDSKRLTGLAGQVNQMAVEKFVTWQLAKSQR